MDCPKVTVSCRLGAYWLSLGCSTTERGLSSVCVSHGALSLFCFLLPHPRGCRTTDNTRTKHSRYSTVCQWTKPFDCVSTLTDAAAPIKGMRLGRSVPLAGFLLCGCGGEDTPRLVGTLGLHGTERQTLGDLELVCNEAV